ncbi:MAG TPA: hypothetical protein VK142_09430 [Bacillota bacterium]|nr:hypothetical protein [Bacillota bacterium]
MKNDKPYWKESLECYVFCFSSFALFTVVAIGLGELTGADWFGLFKQLISASFN